MGKRESLIYAYLQIKNIENKKILLEDVDKESNNNISKWKNCLKIRKHKKEKYKIEEKFCQALLDLKSEEIDFISSKLGEGYQKKELLMIMIPGIGIDKLESICKLIRQESR